jgi:uncharacterized membrane protein|tara:strand:- start:418 stop:582 length:165 start_codon:yes stop_codon:yes gene_type:complete
MVDQFVDKMDIVQALLAMGFTIGLVVIVIVAAAKIGWKLAPWILGAGLIAWLLF